MNLCKTLLDEEYIIEDVDVKGKNQRRLFDLGMAPGVKIKKVFKSIFNDPVAYEIKGTTIAIRNDDAKYIEVREKDA